MKSYKEMNSESLEKYNKMMEEYKTLTECAEFREIAFSMPFEFLNASHLCQSLQLYANMAEKGEPIRMNFSCVEDAIVFYNNLLQLKNKKEDLLNGANYIVEVARKVAEINEFVSENPYLGKSFCIQGDEELFTLAKQCLEEIPKYQDNMTNKFRYCFLEGAIIATKKEELEELVKAKTIIPSDLDNINLYGDESYNEKISMLCKILDHPNPLIESFNLQLKGVMFYNDDGGSRQQILAELKKKMEETKKIPEIIAEGYMYQPDLGKTPSHAIRIKWGEKILGTLDKDLVAGIYEKYENPQFVATLKKINGGVNGLNFGCNIDFGIIAPMLRKEADPAEKEDTKTPEEPIK